MLENFNREYPTQTKTLQQLKDVYKRLKMDAKKRATVRKLHAGGTGGGGPNTSSAAMSTIDEQ